jgi:hypothetical protein
MSTPSSEKKAASLLDQAERLFHYAEIGAGYYRLTKLDQAEDILTEMAELKETSDELEERAVQLSRRILRSRQRWT